MLSPSPGEEDAEALRPQSSAAHALGHPSAANAQTRPSAFEAVGFRGARGLATAAGGRPRGGQRLSLAPQRSQWARKAADLAEDVAADRLLSGAFLAEYLPCLA